MIRHMHISIEGVLANWSNHDLARLFGRSTKEVAEVKRDLLECLTTGIKVLPVGPKCEGWSDITGCPGHENEAELREKNK